MKIQTLPFDSELFGYPVAKLEVQGDWNEFEFLKKAEEFNLVYLFSNDPLDTQDPRILYLNKKVVFKKDLKEKREIDHQVKRYTKTEVLPSLYSLAFQSGAYSRFHVDTRLKQQEFEKMYTAWMDRTLDEDEILVLNDWSGMVTYSVEGEEASIGLLAVANEKRGLGLGSALIHAVEEESLKSGAEFILIPTQDTNKAACQLYQKLGYAIVDETYVYHFKNREI
ncbi:GNAT family N-acetyltransferase [Algoriphagus halophilus]|uniref:Acetyltransferase (GNAT) family protein n=1 Tax=Algoriphagus halophilus TaxID=226505 RepID=A0A1N6EDG8_9BACT|nr:GNAT family N-acetyltransferase [Algoriphagus halophilus]SIN81001.1 Acetyltransferase (GNAT) family protein [Algoriphagus halophilus]